MPPYFRLVDASADLLPCRAFEDVFAAVESGDIEAVLKTKGMAHWIKVLDEAGVPAGPINNLEEVFKDRQVLARGMKLDIPSKAAKKGTIPGVRTPIVLDGWRADSGRPSPLLGEHNEEILSSSQPAAKAGAA